jgi:MauM/NapG family ferredoxin protein
MAQDAPGISAWWRRASQALFLLLFLWLFRRTEYIGGEVSTAVNVFFRFDPLVAAAASLGARALIAAVWPALIVVGLTLALGRFFCGWVCPLGTLLDASHPVVPPRGSGSKRLRPLKYLLLFFILVSALLGLPLVGYLDPFSLLYRGLALAWDPALYFLATAPLDFAYVHAPAGMSAATEPVNAFLKAHVLAYKQTYYELAVLTGAALVAVFALERIERRFWCKNVCPLGALLALLSRFSLLRWQPGIACRDCRDCRDLCRMGAIGEDGRIAPEACNLCLDCIRGCKRNLIGFRFRRPKPRPAPLGVSRRLVLWSVVGGVALPAVFRSRALSKLPDPWLLRPPGAKPEAEFLSRCVRCGECMKVCPTNGLQPALFEAGAEGVWSPALKPRIGYCTYNCNLCGQVCPTGAIEPLRVEVKQKVAIGHSHFDKNRCLPYAKGIPCLVCEEHCPVPEKAIKLREAKTIGPDGSEISIMRPYLVDERCIGCGICEFKCPLPGEAAVRVTAEGESRNPESAPVPTGAGGEG